MKVGLLIQDEDPRVALQVAKAADAAGVHSIWTIDYYNQSSLTRASAFAAATNSVMVGTSVTPLFARAPLAIASAALDIQMMSGGRFVLGVGSSTRRMNQDWYGVDLDHPAPRVQERVQLVRELMSHASGPYEFHGRFDHVVMAHLERKAVPDRPVPIFAAGVGDFMIKAVARVADGFFGHTVASVENLESMARPVIAPIVDERGLADSFTYASQIIASAGADAEHARGMAAKQVGFYSTPKGYDALFPDEADEASRVAAREAFRSGDLQGRREGRTRPRREAHGLRASRRTWQTSFDATRECWTSRCSTRRRSGLSRLTSRRTSTP